jgi:hypothetical protein
VDTPAGAFVLQRINGAVFPAPERIMHNLAALHAASLAHPGLGVRVPALALADELALCARHDWPRLAAHGVHRAEPHPARLDHAGQAREVGRTLGRFHRLGAALDPDAVAVTLPGFHDTPGYLDALDAAVSEPLISTSPRRTCSRPSTPAARWRHRSRRPWPRAAREHA